MAVYDPEKEKTITPNHDGSHDDLGVHPERREAEVDALEKQFGASSATEASDNFGKEEAEDLQDSGWDTDVDSKGDGDQKKKRRGRVRNIAIGGGLTGLLIGGGFGFFAVFSGPFQLIQLGQILNKFSLTNNNSISKRLGSFMTDENLRSLRTGDVGETRVSYVGSKIYRELETRLAEKGVSLRQSGGTLKATLDTGKDLTSYADLDTPDDVRTRLAEKYGVPSENVRQLPGPTEGGKGIWEVESTRKLASQEKILRVVVDGDIADGRISNALFNRVAKKWFDLPSLFHPIDRIGAATDRQFQRFLLSPEEAKQREQLRLEEGRKPTLPERYTNTKAKITEAIDPVRNQIAGALIVAQTVCFVRDTAHLITAFNYGEIVIPSVIEATDKKALGSQLQSGTDVDLTQYGAVTKSFVDENGKSIWEAKSLNALATNTAGKGEDINNDYKQAFVAGNTGNTIIDTISDNGFTEVACSPGGQIAQALAGAALLVFSGGSSTLGSKIVQAGVETAVTGAVMHLVQQIAVGALSTEGIAKYAGPQGGNLYAYGARAAQNLNASAMGGVYLSDSDSKIAMDTVEQEQRDEFQQKSLATRLFDLNDYRSASSRMLRDVSPDPAQNVASVFSGLSPSNVFSKLAQALTPSAYAQEEQYNWDFPLAGIPTSLQENPLYANPYDNASQMAGVLNSPSGAGYIDRAKKCFGATIGKASDGVWDITSSENINPNDDSYVDANCADTSDPNWARMIMFVFDTSIATVQGCWYGDDRMCAQIGASSDVGTTSNPAAGSNVVGDVFESSESVGCAPGTNDLGVHDGYNDGQIVRIRLCGIPNLQATASESTPGSPYYIEGANGNAVVNSRVSGAVLAMVNAASADGVQLSASSAFRSNQHQSALFAANPNPNLVARPGYSNHQMGIAIDFAGTNVKNSSATTCASRQTDPGSPVWSWLSNNAIRFGFRQYSAESWHWDASQGASRCG